MHAAWKQSLNLRGANPALFRNMNGWFLKDMKVHEPWW